MNPYDTIAGDNHIELPMPIVIMAFLVLPATPFWLIAYIFLARGGARTGPTGDARHSLFMS